MRVLIAAAATAVLGACATGETVSFHAQANQTPVIRDGVSAIVSQEPNSLVMVRPAAREFQVGTRPIFVVGINNLSPEPVTFRVADVQVLQTRDGRSFRTLEVKTYEDLVREERTRQVVGALLVGVAAAGNSMAAANAGYSTTHASVNTTSHTRYGTVQSTSVVSATTYSPGVAAAAQAQASSANAAMIDRTIDAGHRNMAALEQAVIKDNTLFPGEWYGGQLHITKPAKEQGSREPTNYTLVIRVGGDTHRIDVVQAAGG